MCVLCSSIHSQVLKSRQRLKKRDAGVHIDECELVQATRIDFIFCLSFSRALALSCFLVHFLAASLSGIYTNTHFPVCPDCFVGVLVTALRMPFICKQVTKTKLNGDASLCRTHTHSSSIHFLKRFQNQGMLMANVTRPLSEQKIHQIYLTELRTQT